MVHRVRNTANRRLGAEGRKGSERAFAVRGPRWLSVPLLALLWLGAGEAACGNNPEAPKPAPAYTEYTRGKTALDEGRLGAARAIFSESLQLDPKMVPSLLGLAEVSIREGNPKRALEPLQEAVSLAPNDAHVQTIWGHYLFWQKQYSQAKTAFNKAMALDPNNVKARRELGDLYLLGFHEPKQAIECYRAALSRDPENARIHFSLSNSLLQVGDLDQATKELEEAARLAPKDLMIAQTLGDLYARRGLLDQAVDVFSRAVALQAKFVPAYLARGLVYSRLGQPDRALADFEAALRIMPHLAPAYIDIGMVQEQSHRFAEAEQAYRTAIHLEPARAIAYNNLAWLDVEQNRNLEEALAYARKAVELEPKVATFQDTLGWVYRAQGQRQQAAASLQSALKLEPQNPEILYHLGLVYSETGRKEAALEMLQKALSLKQHFQEADAARAQVAMLTANRASAR